MDASQLLSIIDAARVQFKNHSNSHQSYTCIQNKYRSYGNTIKYTVFL